MPKRLISVRLLDATADRRSAAPAHVGRRHGGAGLRRPTSAGGHDRVEVSERRRGHVLLLPILLLSELCEFRSIKRRLWPWNTQSGTGQKFTP